MYSIEMGDRQGIRLGQFNDLALGKFGKMRIAVLRRLGRQFQSVFRKESNRNTIEKPLWRSWVPRKS